MEKANKNLSIIISFIIISLIASCENRSYELYENWDADGDSKITLEEFVDAIAETNFFSALDTDGNNLIDENEFAEGVHAHWDLDKSGFVEDVEYHEWYPVYWGM